MRRRTDKTEAARKGSQRHLQWCANNVATRLSATILNHVAPRSPAATITWLSPLARSGYSEYRDAAMIARLGLDTSVAQALSKFWPLRGPVWDGLAIADIDGAASVLLVEAKSHREECKSVCKATARSRRKIESALAWAREALGVEHRHESSWLNAYYQSANRLATVAFLRSLSIDARLVNVYFVNDQCWGRNAVDEGAWKLFEDEMRKELGFEGVWPQFVISAYVDAEGGCDGAP